MEEIKIILELFKQYGISGVLIGIIVWDKIIYPKWKKAKGTYVSYNEIRDENTELRMRMAKLENKVDHHLEKEAVEDIKMGKFEVKLDALEDKVNTENDHIFNQLKSIHESVGKLLMLRAERK